MLELVLDADIPETAFGVGSLLVVTVFESGSHERWFLVAHVIHTEREGGVVEPGSPSARIVLRRRNRHHVFLFAILHPHVLAPILGVTRDFRLRCRRWEVEGVVVDQVHRDPFAVFFSHPSHAPVKSRGGYFFSYPSRSTWDVLWRYRDIIGNESQLAAFRLRKPSRSAVGCKRRVYPREARPQSIVLEGKCDVIPVLSDVVNDYAGVDALRPRTGRPVVEETGVPAV